MPSALTAGAVRLFYKLYLQKRDNPQTDNQYRRDQRTGGVWEGAGAKTHRLFKAVPTRIHMTC